MNTELYPIQTQLIANIRDTVRNGVKRLVVQAPTGFGKTKCAAAIIDSALMKGNKVSFVVPAISLVDQCVESFWAEGIKDIGVLQACHPMQDASRPVQVCSIQTISARKVFPPSRIVIVDEVHRLHKTHIEWLNDPAFSNAIFIGLSATPWSKGLGKHFQTLLIAATTQELIDSGHLSKFKVFACPKADVSEVGTGADGDYRKGELSEVMREGTLTADIVKTWQERWGKGKTLVFCVDRQHAQTVHERFLEAGVRSAYQDANTSDGERACIRRGFADGTYQVVCNIGTLTTGVDWDVRCLVLARPTKSEILYTQIVGRALRTASGKDHALILDHSDTTERLGFVTDIHHDGLNDGKPRQKAASKDREKPLPRPCPQCASINPRVMRVCPDCGFKLPLASGVIERDGVLVEMKPGEVARRAPDCVHTMSDKAAWYGQLLWWAQHRGFKDGWVANQFRARFGVWPKVGYVQPIRPTVEVMAFITAMQQQWIKQRLKAKRHMEASP